MTGSERAFGREQLANLGHQIRALRERRRWSLKRLARESGISITAIRKIELGEANPGLLTILAIVDSKEPDQVVNPRDQKLEVIKQRCLQAAQVKYICVYPPQLPRYRELREQILGPAADLV